MFFASVAFADDPGVIKIPEIPSTEEIRKTLADKSPISAFSLSLFDSFTSGRAGGGMLRLGAPEGAVAPATQIVPTGSNRVNALVAEYSAHVQSTGDASFDNALDKLRVTAANMAFQAALYDGLRSLKEGAIEIPDFKALENYFKSLVDKRGDDGHFFALNRDFLIAIALAQYQAEVSFTLDHKLEEFAQTHSKHNALGFKEAIELVPVEEREVVWNVAENEAATRRQFLAVQEQVRDELAIKHFPDFQDTFSPDDFPFVLSLIDGKLRDMKVAVPIVNWCIQNARNTSDLLQLLINELKDAVFIRFRSLKLNDPKANPFTMIPHQNDLASGEITVPEEPFFTQILGVVLVQAEHKFQVSRQRMLVALTKHFIKVKPTSISFRFETLFRHIELLLSETTELEEWDSILTDIGALIAAEAANEESSLHVCREELADRIQYLREEIVVRKKGWVPIHPEAFTEIIEIIQRHAHANDGEPKDPAVALELAAARRALNELSDHILSDVMERATRPNSKYLASRSRAKHISGCLVELTRAWLQAEDDDRD